MDSARGEKKNIKKEGWMGEGRESRVSSYCRSSTTALHAVLGRTKRKGAQVTSWNLLISSPFQFISSRMHTCRRVEHSLELTVESFLCARSVPNEDSPKVISVSLNTRANWTPNSRKTKIALRVYVTP